MPLLTRRAVLGAKIETVKGTDAVPTTPDAGIVVSDVGYTPQVEVIEREQVSQTFSQPDHLIGNQAIEFSFNLEMKGHVAAGLPGDASAALRACAVQETVGADVAYGPITDLALQETATIALFWDGKLFKAIGCAGNARLVNRENEKPRWEFTMRGIYVAESDSPILTPAFLATRPPDPVGATAFSYRSQTLIATGFEMDFQNQVELREDITQPSGYLHALIANRAPIISIDPEDMLIASFGAAGDFLSQLIAGTAGEFQYQIGTVGGNRHTLVAPHAQISEGPLADRTGKVIRNLVLALRRNSVGDDEWSYTVD